MNKKTKQIIYEKNSHLIDDLVVLDEVDMLTDQEIIQVITDSIDDGLKLMRRAKNNSDISTCECIDVVRAIASRISFAAAVLTPDDSEEIREVMSKIHSFCGSIMLSKNCFIDRPELIERIFPFFQTVREWVETLVLRENNYKVASNLSSSLLADLNSFEAILGINTSEKEDDDDDFFLL